MRSILILCCLLPGITKSQSVPALIEKIYQRAEEQKTERIRMGDHVYRQAVHFIKLDGDGDVDEQSKRVFQVYARPPDLTKRVLISAENYEDGEWIDVTMEERKANRGAESRQFSLLEMVGPAGRDNYTFSIRDTFQTDTFRVYRLRVAANEKDEDYFEGDLWINSADYSLFRAELTPSELPTGLDSMKMSFDLQPVNGHWLPHKVVFDAKISFLFIFKGRIKTTIKFSDYKLNQTISNAMFEE